jgi:hypothetical protein
MRKIYSAVALLALTATFSVAQNRQVSTSRTMEPISHLANSADRTPTDTLYWGNTSAQPTLIGSQNGGFVVGNNGYGDLAKVQAFFADQPPLPGNAIALEEVIIWFGAKDFSSGDSVNSILKINAYRLNANGTASSGTVNTAPGTVLASVDLPIALADTGSALGDGGNIIAFPNPVWLGFDFGVGVDFSALAAGDTIGIVSTTDGGAFFPDMSWEKWDNNAWYTMKQAWPLDIDFAIWPIVDNNPTGLGEEIAINGVKLYQNFPNPSANGTTTITYEIGNNAKNIVMNIFDAKGRMVMEINEGAKSMGKYTVNIDANQLSSGVYYYTITVDGSRLGKKMTIAK